MVRNNICINSHPTGCAAAVREQIAFLRSARQARQPTAAGTASVGELTEPTKPRLALILGCSTGYGLASRIVAGFGYGAATVGVSLEKAATEKKPGTPGWYNNLVFDRDAHKAGLVSITLDGDAFSDQMKAKTADTLREAAKQAGVPAKLDLIVYSLASPVRTDPKTGTLYRSVIKPIGAPYSGKTLDTMTGVFRDATAEPATPDEIAATVKVMGGEDWELWLDALAGEGLVGEHTRTVAYTYIGPELSWAIYKNGTIGHAKQDLERAAKAINAKFAGKFGGAFISVNKAVVTRSSAVIPIIPLYVSCLFKVMKEKGIHEGCIEQITRLFRERLYAGGSVPTDSEGRIRIDDREMRDDVQAEVARRMNLVNEANMNELCNVAGFRHDFLETNGFDVAGVDYTADVDPSGKGL
jgi:enoyl-[acyl-carrier protein] reductase/trans-2-enoyl-CoA reductase (NAD+)